MTRRPTGRLDQSERTLGDRRRVHYFFWNLNETKDQVRARMRAKIASGEAKPNDKFVVFTWTRPESEEVTPNSDN